jgi:two-component system LytT family sensor kinase
VHVLGWVLFIALTLTIVSRESTLLTMLSSVSLWLFFLLYCFLFYVNLLILVPRLFLKRKYVFYTIVFVTGIALIYVAQPFEHLVFQKVHHQSRQPAPALGAPAGKPPVPPFGDGPPHMQARTHVTVDFVSLVLFVVVWVVGMAMGISRQWQLFEKKVIQSEADKAQAELSFFKAQINPHFLFNTLNNIYSMAVSQSENTASSILKLSQLMRYITEEATEHFVALQDEIICLENYIELQKLRLNSKTEVSFHVKGTISGTRVAPLIFMTFIENAFKYGVSNHHRSDVEITIEVSDTEVVFSCKNRIFAHNQADEGVGIGIANTRKRLDFLYPHRYSLHIQEDEPFFWVSLKLPLV